MPSLITIGAFVTWLAAPTWAQMGKTVQRNWVFPEFPDYTTTLTNKQQTSFSWDAYLQDWFSQYCGPCNTTNVDLWVVGGSEDEYQYKVAGSVDVTDTLSVPWTVEIDNDALSAQQTWSLRFIPHDTKPHGSGTGAEISSPGFQIIAAPSSSQSTSGPTSTTLASLVSSSISSTSSPSATDATNTASATPILAASQTHAASSGVSAGAQVGIGVGVGVGAFSALSLIGVLLLRRRRNKRAAAFAAPQSGGNLQKYSPLGTSLTGGNYLDQKGPQHDLNGSPPAPPYNNSPLNQSGYKLAPQQQQVQAQELNAHSDPAELEGIGRRGEMEGIGRRGEMA